MKTKAERLLKSLLLSDIGGKVVVEGLSLTEGTVVTVLARGDEVAVRLRKRGVMPLARQATIKA